MGPWTIDWKSLFVPGGSLAEIALRGAVMYLALFCMFRLLPRRHIGLLGTILLLDYAIDWLDFRFPALRLNAPRPEPLVIDGRLVRSTLDRQKITEEELIEQLREQGVEDLRDIARAYMEGDGHISVIRRKAGERPPAPRRTPA